MFTMRSLKLPGANTVRIALLAATVMLGPGAMAAAQSAGTGDGWDITVYPLLVWVPLDIGIGVDVPPFDGDGGVAGDIIESQFDGAFFGGVAASNGIWRIEGYGLWASFGGDRPQRPSSATAASSAAMPTSAQSTSTARARVTQIGSAVSTPSSGPWRR